MDENDEMQQRNSRLSEEVLRQLGHRVAERRRARGLSQRELERRAGFSSSRLSRIERGHSVAQLSELVGLCDILGISLDELVFGAPKEAGTGRLGPLVRRFEATVDPFIAGALETLILCLMEEAS